MRRYLPTVGACAVLLVVLLLFENLAAQTFQSCVSQRYTDYGPYNPHDYGKVVGVFLGSQGVCSFRFIGLHEGAFAALAAFVVAGFTFALWDSTEKLWSEANRQRREARNSARINAVAARAALRNAEAIERQLRAWVSLAVDLESCKRTNDFAHIGLNVRLANLGSTPALRVGISLGCAVKPGTVSNYGTLPTPQKNLYPAPSLMPGGETSQSFNFRIKKNDIAAGTDAARKARSPPMIVVDVIVCYHSVFDAETAPKHMTSVRHSIFPLIDTDDPAHLPARMAWLDERGPASIDEVWFAQDKSAPVYMT